MFINKLGFLSNVSYSITGCLIKMDLQCNSHLYVEVYSTSVHFLYSQGETG